MARIAATVLVMLGVLVLGCGEQEALDPVGPPPRAADADQTPPAGQPSSPPVEQPMGVAADQSQAPGADPDGGEPKVLRSVGSALMKAVAGGSGEASGGPPPTRPGP